MPTIEAISAVENVLKLASAPQDFPTTEAMSQKFESLMKPSAGAEHGHDAHAHANAEDSTQGMSAITDVLSKKEALMNEAFADAKTFSAEASSMSMNELMSANMDLSRRMTMASVGMQSVTALGQSSNKSLQSLLKNQ
jgi:hypothetical protein